MTAPWIVGLIIFAIVPIAVTAVWSFQRVSLSGTSEWVQWDNYLRLWNDKNARQAAINTGIFIVIGLPLSILGSFALALILRSMKSAAVVFRVAVYLPTVIPVVAAAYLWRFMLEPEKGTINTFLSWFGIDGPAWLADPTWARVAVLLMVFWACGATVLIYLAALIDIPAEFYEAAELDGANWWHRIRYIDWPMMRGVTVFQTIMAVIGFFQLFTQPFLLAQERLNPSASGPENSLLTFSIYIYQQAFVYLDFGYGAALSWVLFLVIFAVSLAVLRSINRPIDE